MASPPRRSLGQRLQDRLLRLQAVEEEQHEPDAEERTSSAHAGAGRELQSKFQDSGKEDDQVANLVDLPAKIPPARAASSGSSGFGGDDQDELLTRWSFGLTGTASRSSTFPKDDCRSPAAQHLARTTRSGGQKEVLMNWPHSFTLDISDLMDQCDADIDVISDVLAESVTQGASSIDTLEEAASRGDIEQISYHSVFIESLAASVGARKLECSASSLTILVDSLSSGDDKKEMAAANELMPAVHMLQEDFQDFSLNVVNPANRNKSGLSFDHASRKGSFSSHIFELCDRVLSTQARGSPGSPMGVVADKLAALLQQDGEGGASATFDSSTPTLRSGDSDVGLEIKDKAKSFDTAGLTPQSKQSKQLTQRPSNFSSSSPAKARAKSTGMAPSSGSSPVLKFSDDNIHVEAMLAGENVAATTQTVGAARRAMDQQQSFEEEVDLNTVFEVTDGCLKRMNSNWGDREEVEEVAGVIVDACKSARLHRVVKRCKVLEEWCKTKGQGMGSGRPMVDAVEQQLETSKAMYKTFAVCV